MKSILSKIIITSAIMLIIFSSFALAAVKPEFYSNKFFMQLGSTQYLSGITNIDQSEYSKIQNSNPSVVQFQNGTQLKAISTGATTLTYTYGSEGEKIECYIEVTLNNSTFSPINPNAKKSVTITLSYGEYYTTINCDVGTTPTFPDVKREGYILEGWYKDANYNTKVSKTERFREDITLYAKWITEAEANTPNVSHSSLYDDIDYHWARNQIESVSYRGLFNGVTPRMFQPDKSMTRAMVVTVLGRLEEVEDTGRKVDFVDVPDGAYYENYLAWAVENNIVTGTSDTEFSPSKEITRQEMAIMMANYIKYKGYDYELKELYYKDVNDISTWALESVKILDNLKIMQGNSDGTYNPRKVATRAEIATIFFNYLNYIYSK